MAAFPQPLCCLPPVPSSQRSDVRNKVGTVLRTIAPIGTPPKRSSFGPSAATILTEIRRHIRKASLESIER